MLYGLTECQTLAMVNRRLTTRRTFNDDNLYRGS